MADLKQHRIVVLGGSYAGLGIAHTLINKTTPSLKAANPGNSYVVTVVSASSHFFFNVGAPRNALTEDQFKIDDSFLPIDKGFANYDKSLYELKYAEVDALDSTNKSLAFVDGTSLTYDTLIIATGATSDSPLWSLHGSHHASRAAFVDMQQRLQTAKSVLIAGAGAAGVETAGELGTMFGRKPTKGTHKAIEIVSGTDRLLPALPPSVSRAANAKLQGMGVKVTLNRRVASTTESPTGTTVTFADGSSQTVDIYINSMGRKPNTAFIRDPALLDARGAVIVDANLRVTGADGVYAIGDVASASKGDILSIISMKPYLASVIESDLATHKQLKPYAPMTEKPTQFVPIGPSGGVGAVFGWKVFSWMVWLLKSRDFMMGRAEMNVMGTA